MVGGGERFFCCKHRIVKIGRVLISMNNPKALKFLHAVQGNYHSGDCAMTPPSVPLYFFSQQNFVTTPTPKPPKGTVSNKHRARFYVGHDKWDHCRSLLRTKKNKSKENLRKFVPDPWPPRASSAIRALLRDAPLGHKTLKTCRLKATLSTSPPLRSPSPTLRPYRLSLRCQRLKTRVYLPANPYPVASLHPAIRRC